MKLSKFRAHLKSPRFEISALKRTRLVTLLSGPISSTSGFVLQRSQTMKHFLPARSHAGRQAGQSHSTASCSSRVCTALWIVMNATRTQVRPFRRHVVRRGSRATRLWFRGIILMYLSDGFRRMFRSLVPGRGRSAFSHVVKRRCQKSLEWVPAKP